MELAYGLRKRDDSPYPDVLPEQATRCGGVCCCCKVSALGRNRFTGKGRRRIMRVGDVVDGRVLSVQHDGAWIEIDAERAFVPIAEVAWFEIEHPSERLAAGDVVRAKVIGRMQAGHWECSIRQVEERPDAH
jgi:exosome complex RNA-binding protein Csl4